MSAYYILVAAMVILLIIVLMKVVKEKPVTVTANTIQAGDGEYHRRKAAERTVADLEAEAGHFINGITQMRVSGDPDCLRIAGIIGNWVWNYRYDTGVQTPEFLAECKLDQLTEAGFEYKGNDRTQLKDFLCLWYAGQMGSASLIHVANIVAFQESPDLMAAVRTVMD